MASCGGARARGTDGSDFNYRQRVDDHYKLMVTARRKLRSASNLQLASALGLMGVTGVSFVLPDVLGTAAAAVCLGSAIVTAMTAKYGLGGASAQQPESQLGMYAKLCLLSIILMLGMSGLAGATVVMTPRAENAWVSVVVIFSLLGLVGSFLGNHSGKELANAFEQQRAKSKSAAAR